MTEPAASPVPTVPVTFQREGVTVLAPYGAILRDLALAHGINPHPHVRKLFNCGGIGDCTTCLVRLDVSPDDDPAAVNPPTEAERQWPGKWPADWRLSCQVRVLGPMAVETRPRRSGR